MPRFLNTSTGEFEWQHDAASVVYAILSHRWLHAEQEYPAIRELQDLVREEKKNRAPLSTPSPARSDAADPLEGTIFSRPELSDKIKGICAVARKAGYRLIWIDACCIDKSSSAELSEAINSMYQWYQLADVCYVYLDDVPDEAADGSKTVPVTDVPTRPGYMPDGGVVQGAQDVSVQEIPDGRMDMPNKDVVGRAQGIVDGPKDVAEDMPDGRRDVPDKECAEGPTSVFVQDVSGERRDVPDREVVNGPKDATNKGVPGWKDMVDDLKNLLKPLGGIGGARASLFSKSMWHTRGWTLQELIAPKRMVFLTQQWTFLGTKLGLASMLAMITGVDINILTGRAALDSVSVARKMSWAARRQTTRVEDRAYSLMGIFGVFMPTIYGEGQNAFLRLQEEILRTIPDQSIFAWGRILALDRLDSVEPPRMKGQDTGPHNFGLLAPSPREFGASVTGRINKISPEVFASRLPGKQVELPSLRSVLTPHGIELQLLCIDLARTPQIFLARSSPSCTAEDCPECLKGYSRVLALLQCEYEDGTIVALPLCRPEEETWGDRGGLLVGIHAPCSWGHTTPYRVVSLTSSALAGAISRLSREPVLHCLLRHQEQRAPKFDRALAKSNLRSTTHVFKPGKIFEFRIAPRSVEELAVLGFGLSDLRCQYLGDSVVLTTSLNYRVLRHLQHRRTDQILVLGAALRLREPGGGFLNIGLPGLTRTIIADMEAQFFVNTTPGYTVTVDTHRPTVRSRENDGCARRSARGGFVQLYSGSFLTNQRSPWYGDDFIIQKPRTAGQGHDSFGYRLLRTALEASPEPCDPSRRPRVVWLSVGISDALEECQLFGPLAASGTPQCSSRGAKEGSDNLRSRYLQPSSRFGAMQMLLARHKCDPNARPPSASIRTMDDPPPIEPSSTVAATEQATSEPPAAEPPTVVPSAQSPTAVLTDVLADARSSLSASQQLKRAGPPNDDPIGALSYVHGAVLASKDILALFLLVIVRFALDFALFFFSHRRPPRDIP